MTWVSADAALRSFEDRREQSLEEQRQHSLERARSRPQPRQLPLMAVVGHVFNPTPIDRGEFTQYQPGCSCGWLSRRRFYVENVAKLWWRNRHLKAASK